MNRAVVLMSGGIDSAVALAWSARQGFGIVALSFNYYLRPFRERLSVYRLLQNFPSHLIEIPMPYLREAADLKEPLPGNVPEGYISNRNMIFYSIASYHAEIYSCDVIVGGHNLGDQESFPDAASTFVSSLQALTNEALLTRKIRIELPLRDMDKTEVLRKALEWDVPLEHTWSCYWDQSNPCGKCESCRERAEAFANLGIIDPLTAKSGYTPSPPS
jgi:7-cyano-7-deazaguanine synthase